MAKQSVDYSISTRERHCGKVLEDDTCHCHFILPAGSVKELGPAVWLRSGAATTHGEMGGLRQFPAVTQRSLDEHEGKRCVVILFVQWGSRGKDQPARNRPSAKHLPPEALW